MNAPIVLAAVAAVSLSLPAAASGGLKLVSPSDGETVSALTEAQRRFLDLPAETRMKWMADPDRRRELRKGGVQPVRLSWEDPAAEGGPRRSYNVSVVREDDGLPVFLDTTVGDSVEVRNLEIGRDWLWTVRAMEGGRVVDTATGVFKTEDRAPRVIDAGEVPNVRDIGGRVGLDGRRVRQGLVFRTAGMNSNAKSSPYTADEVAAMRESGAVDAFAKAWAVRKASLEGVKGSGRPVSPVAFPLSSKWTVFYPDTGLFAKSGAAAIVALGSSVPETFLGAEPQAAEADASGKVVLGEARDCRGPAVLMQVVDAPEEGWATVGCGADWYWALSIGGVPLADRVMGGNSKSPIDANNAPLLVPVEKGPNLVVATVYSGSGGWCWCMRAAPPEPIARVVSKSLADAEAGLAVAETFRGGTPFIPGKNRTTSPETRHLLLDTLAFKTDIDLRSDGECAGMTGAPLGDSVGWTHVSSACYEAMQGDWGRKQFAKVFRVFLDKSNYPIAFHCIAGRDRTGAVAFIVEGLLGVEEDELRKDWEATVFRDGDMGFTTERLYLKLLDGFEKLPGDTLAEKLEGYVLSLGFTREDVEFLRDWLLEP
ncbi:MAG: tyrosine-protein phosphatase [Kiritimatiellae bacterium]|nr:tyrosine-protein phosphatase [Kiritimatiellia bacterium]